MKKSRENTPSTCVKIDGYYWNFYDNELDSAKTLWENLVDSCGAVKAVKMLTATMDANNISFWFAKKDNFVTW